MKNRIAVLALLLSSASAVSAAVVYDGFDYPVGPLEGNTNPTAPATTNGFSNTNVWTRSGTATTGPGVVNGSLSYPGLPTPVGNSAMLTGINGTSLTADRIAVPDYHAGDTIWFSMILQVPSSVTNYGSTSTSGSFFTGFSYTPDSLSGTNTFNTGTQSSAAPLLVRKAADGLGYNLGIGYRDLAAVRQFGATEYTAGQTLFLVGKYVIGSGMQDDAAYLYVNPTDLSTEPTTPEASSINTTGSGTNDFFYANDGTQLETTLRSFILRNNAVEPANMQIDELRIGSSYTDVTGVPEPTSAAALTLLGAALTLRRRRAS